MNEAPKSKKPILQRRPRQLSFRLSPEEDNALWALHVQTRKSKAQLMRELISEGLQSRGVLSAKVVKEILAREKVIRVTPRAPTL